MSAKIEELKKDNNQLMSKYDDLSRLYLDVSRKARQFDAEGAEIKDTIQQYNKLQMALSKQVVEEKDRWTLEHKRYVYCKQMLEHKEMEMQRLTIQHEVDLTELKHQHK